VQRFTQKHRLKKAGEFSSVFLFRGVVHGEYLKIHYKPNQLLDSRLGLVVGKRVHKKANRRNYMKRSLRELFRCNQSLIDGIDIIIRVVKYFDYTNRADINQEFIFLLNKLNHKLHRHA